MLHSSWTSLTIFFVKEKCWKVRFERHNVENLSLKKKFVKSTIFSKSLLSRNFCQKSVGVWYSGWCGNLIIFPHPTIFCKNSGISKLHQGYQYTNPYTKPWFLYLIHYLLIFYTKLLLMPVYLAFDILQEFRENKERFSVSFFVLPEKYVKSKSAFWNFSVFFVKLKNSLKLQLPLIFFPPFFPQKFREIKECMLWNFRFFFLVL